MERRAFLGIVGGAAAWPLAATSQQRKVWRVGFVSGNTRPEKLESSIMGGFPQGMRELGYVEGRDFIIEWRFAEARAERYDAIADELAKLKVISSSSVRPRPLARCSERRPRFRSCWAFRPIRLDGASRKACRVPVE